MALHAKLFQNGGSQAVRLPKECRFPEGETEVLVRRQGQQIILEPIDAWTEEFLAILGAWPEDIERPPQEPLSKLADPFR
jgi:antitoxin VapB